LLHRTIRIEPCYTACAAVICKFSSVARRSVRVVSRQPDHRLL